MYFNQRELANYAQCRFNMIMHEWGLETSEGDVSLFDTPLWELSWWSWKTDKLWYFFLFCFVFLSAHLCAATLTACLVAPRSKKKKKRFSKCTGPDCGLRYLMLDHFSNCNISERQIGSFTLYEIQVGLFHFAPNWKSHFTGCFCKLCYSEWAITYTNMTQKSFWPKAPYFPASSEQVIFTW